MDEHMIERGAMRERRDGAWSSDGESIRRGAAELPAGVVAVTAMTPAGPLVLVTSSLSTGVSFDPPMVAFAVQRTSTSWPELRVVPRLGLSVLSEDHTDVVRQLASRDRRLRLSGIDVERRDDGSVFLLGAIAWLSCSLVHEYPAGDHTLAVLRVHAMRDQGEGRPLVAHRRRFLAIG